MNLSWYWKRARRMSTREVAIKVARLGMGRARLRTLRMRARPLQLLPGRALPFESRNYRDLSSPDLLVEADRLIRGERKVLGLGWLSATQWKLHADPRSGFEWPLVPSYRLQYRTPNTEIRLCWELNRLHDICILSMAYYTTRDPQYLDAVKRTLDVWVHANPVGYGPNWISAMEAGIRTVNATWAAKLTSPSGDRHLADLFGSVLDSHARFIRMWLSTGSSANNHLLIELMGLIYVESFWNFSVGHAGQWIDRYIQELQRQTGPAGMNREMSSHYHLLVCESTLHVIMALRARHIENAALDRLFRSMVEVVRALSLPDGMCIFGDDDDGAIVRLPSKTGRWDLGLTGEESTPWLQCPLASTSVREESFRVDNYDGIVVVSTRLLRVVIDAAAHGLEPLYAHGHDDSGSIYVGAGNSWFVTDPGTYVYLGDISLRALFRSRHIHNGPRRLEDRAASSDPFMWDTIPSTPSVDIVSRDSTAAITVTTNLWTRTINCTATTVEVRDMVHQPGPTVVRLTLNPSWETVESGTQWIDSNNPNVRVSLDVLAGAVEQLTTPFSDSFGTVGKADALVITGEPDAVWILKVTAS